MVLLTRCLAVLTVLLGLALMAVSAYAATNEPQRWAETVGLAGDEAEPSPAEGAAAITATLEAEATATAATKIEPTPTPKIAVRYPAPERAAPALRMRSGRADLSAGPRVWRVPSFRPGAANSQGPIANCMISKDRISNRLQISHLRHILPVTR